MKNTTYPVSSLPTDNKSVYDLFYILWSNELKDELNIRGLDEIHIVVGGVIPKEDFSPLLDSGASAIFATGTNIVDSAAELLNLLEIK